MLRSLFLLALLALLPSNAAPARAQGLDKLTIVVFSSPSLGNFLPPVIKAQKLDEKHGLSITYAERTPDAYTAQFNSGEFQIGGSAAVLTIGLADVRGVKAAYLFNLFDYWGAVVTSRPEIKTLADLKGKDLVAAKGTTNYVMFDWLARQQGLDTRDLSVVNTATPGLVGYAVADRGTAVQLWEPAYTALLAKKPSMRSLDLKIAESWRKAAGSGHIPYLGVAAHLDWAEKNPGLVVQLFDTYREAAAWIVAHPDEAGKLISPRGSAEDQKAISDLIRANDRLGMNVQWAADMKREIEETYRAARSIDFLPGDPSPASIYPGPPK